MTVTPRVETLLQGRSLTAPEGGIGFCGTYLVTVPGERGCRIVFDPGHAGRRKALVASLAGSGLVVNDIDMVVLSHAHWDHAQNADLFPRAKVVLHGAELEDVSAEDRVLDIATPGWTSAMLSAVGAQAVSSGERLAQGVEVVGLPGHTRGSIGLRVETASGTAILAGDAVSRRNVAARRTRAVANFDAEAARLSIESALATATHIWPGHDRPFAVVDGVAGNYLIPVAELVWTDHS